MIEVYPVFQEDFTRHGIALHPTSCKVRHEGGGRYDLTMVLPMIPGGEYTLLDYDMPIKAPVPRQDVPEITLGVISYWKVPDDATADVPLYKSLGYYTRATYSTWAPARSYMAGDKVTYEKQNYRCTTGHGGITTPPPSNPNLWTAISNYSWVPGKVAATLSPGTSFIKTNDFNSTYMRAATLGGVTGYIEIAKVVQVSEDEPRVLPARTITHQLFRVRGIRPETSKHTVTVHAVHESYALNGMLLGECSLTAATPQTALEFLAGSMMGAWEGLLVTNIDGDPVTVDWSYKMAGDALLNPDKGFVAMLDGKLIRDNRDFIILPNEETDPVFEIAYGVNLLGLDWDGNVDSLISQVYPRAKAADGTDLFLPEMYVSTTRTLRDERMELLNVDLKVGDTITETDGTEVTLTEEEVLTRMRARASDRFTKDRCDEPVIKLKMDFLRLGDTCEYAKYRNSEYINPYDWIRVRCGPMGISAAVQMTGFEWDAVNELYDSATFGTVQNVTRRSVTGWQIRSGSVSARTLDENLRKVLGV